MVRCTECGAALDVDEDEVEEGEILTCPECEVDLEVVQVQPVHLNVISDDEEAEEDEEESGDEEDNEEPSDEEEDEES